MKLTCEQMDILISFYIENEISPALKKQVEEHLKNCKKCDSKYNMIKSMVTEIKDSLSEVETFSDSFPTESYDNNSPYHYDKFKTNLSAYIDNELSTDENLKIKKYTIRNRKARKDLEESYSIRKLMNDSFQKSKNELRQDFSRNIIKRLELEDERAQNFYPAIKILITFTISVLFLTTVVLISLSL